ncbi:MAG: hypothetical protein HLUCCA12_14755 [Rhodobacteraceae bacterium HLUCCA12]|nr:MAG: hypothetical protein HLUCCA12_14755 [Rhodobacteraceae bacterium HLUCCA12]
MFVDRGLSLEPSVVIICPGEIVSGGPEALHQLGRALLDLGVPAAMCYFPFERVHACPSAFATYGVPVCRFDEICAAKIVLPEARTGFARLFPDNRCWIWWLSVDHYQTGAKTDRHLPLVALRSLGHFSQSAYAQAFLSDHGLTAQMLGDYLNPAHLTARPAEERRLRQIAYNPKKGSDVVATLKSLLPGERFVPIENMTPAGVSELLRQSRLYIDFGPHPGKDRLPREAAMAGCCILTGRRGAAGYAQDVAIPSRYRIDERAADFPGSAISAIRRLLDQFETCTSEFDAYRAHIAREPALFMAQVEAAFGPADPSRSQAA